MSAPRTLVALAGLITLTGASLWIATGREGYTRWPNAKLAAADTGTSDAEDDLLADIGIDTEPAENTDIQSRFAFGLVPGGADPKHLLSLASSLGLAAALAALAGVIARHERDTPTPDAGEH